MTDSIGISLDGVLLKPNLDQLTSGRYVDNWFPPVIDSPTIDYFGVETDKSTTPALWNYYGTDLKDYKANFMDQCHGSISESGEYYYSSASKCIYDQSEDWNVIDRGVECKGCYGSMDGTIKAVTSEYVGLAKDGHIIYGPQTKWDETEKKNVLFTPCDLDGCNGLRECKKTEVEQCTEASISYHATSWHPYLVGCFGPATMQESSIISQYCSSNGKYCGAIVSIASSSLLATITVLSLLMH